MTIRPLRVYADTSVFGGVFDDEFATASQTFFQQVQQGQFQLVTSFLVQDEIESAPEQVRQFFNLISQTAEFIELSEAALQLRQVYIQTGIVTQKSLADALHVALATVADCSLIVSWNFKHIVHFDKIPLYQAVNLVQGYTEISIYSPLEVISYEEEL